VSCQREDAGYHIKSLHLNFFPYIVQSFGRALYALVSPHLICKTNAIMLHNLGVRHENEYHINDAKKYRAVETNIVE
jgi:hypothetical protein